MKKIIVDDNTCIGCGACISIDSEHFTFSDDGLSMVASQENLETEELQSAIENCPVNAITFGCGCDDACDCGDNCDCGSNCECKEKDE